MRKEEVVREISKIVDYNLGETFPTDEELFSSSVIDSLDMLCIIMGIEGQFNIHISDDYMQEIADKRLSIEGLADKLIQAYDL